MSVSKKCVYCGELCSFNANFCKQCGHHFEDVKNEERAEFDGFIKEVAAFRYVYATKKEDPDVDGYIKALERENERAVRLRAIWALGEIGESRAVEPLIIALNDADIYLRWSVVDALAKIGSTKAVEPLTKVLTDPSEIVRRRAKQSFWEMRETKIIGKEVRVENPDRRDVEFTTCANCKKRIPIPKTAPEFGTRLICANCRYLIVQSWARDAPGSTPGKLLAMAFGTSYAKCCLIHSCCVWCGKMNYAVLAPERGRLLDWYIDQKPENINGFTIPVRCTSCDKQFYIGWDENPLSLEPTSRYQDPAYG